MAMLQQGHRRRTIHHNPRRMYVCMYLSIYLSDKQRRKNHLVHHPSPTSPSHHSPPQSPSPALSNFLTSTCSLTQNAIATTQLHSVTLPMRKSRITLNPLKATRPPPPPSPTPAYLPIPSHPTPPRKPKTFARPQPKLLNPLPHPTESNQSPAPSNQ
jgi:hypothetical protein